MNLSAIDKRLSTLEGRPTVKENVFKSISQRMKKPGQCMKGLPDNEKAIQEICYGEIDWENELDMWRVLRGLVQVRQANPGLERINLPEFVSNLRDFLNNRGTSTPTNTKILKPGIPTSDEDVAICNELSVLLSWIHENDEIMDSIRRKSFGKREPLTAEEQKHIDRVYEGHNLYRISVGLESYDVLFEGNPCQGE